MVVTLLLLLMAYCAHRSVPKPASLPKDDLDQAVQQVQALSLQPQCDSTAWDSGPGLHTSSTSHDHSQHNPNQDSMYEPQRDGTAQPMSAWHTEQYGYHDSSPYTSYGEYGEYYDQETYEPELGDDWDQLGFAAEPHSPQSEGQDQPGSGKAQAAGRKPADQQLCSQFQVSGDCPRGSNCHMAHGDLCQVLCSLWEATRSGCQIIASILAVDRHVAQQHPALQLHVPAISTLHLTPASDAASNSDVIAGDLMPEIASLTKPTPLYCCSQQLCCKLAGSTSLYPLRL